MIAIDQDPLGAGAAKIAAKAPFEEIWARPLAGGSIAVGLLNAGFITTEMTFDLAAAGLEGAWKVRDVWRQRDEGAFTGVYRRKVGEPHPALPSF